MQAASHARVEVLPLIKEVGRLEGGGIQALRPGLRYGHVFGVSARRCCECPRSQCAYRSPCCTHAWGWVHDTRMG
jgi:hypothetical protein